MSNIGTVIRDLRKKQGFTQEQFSEQAGISTSCLSQIENNLKKPNRGNILKICNILGVSESLLYLATFTEQDIPEHKREQLKCFVPVVKAIVDQFIY